MQVGLLMFPSPKPGGSAGMGQLVEQFGFDSLVFADTQCLTPEVWGQLMLVAAATERIQIATGVTNPVSRDASVTASAVLGLQVASEGRAVLGIGRGDSSMAKIGRRPASRSAFETYLALLRAYLSGETVDRDGTPSRIEWLDECDAPRVPIEVAATGPKVIDVAARHADRICFAVGADPERLRRSIRRARTAAEAAGRDPEFLRFGAYINCVVHPDVERAREAIRGGLSSFARFSGVHGMNVDAAGSGETYDMAGHGKSDSAHARSMDADYIHQFGIAGPVTEAVTRFAQLRDAGIDFVRIVPGSRDADPGVVMESLQAIASEIIPAVAGETP